ncbi:siphovirus Gp157 family protein [Paenibacillus senegalensis]|uniref:siphovirus Gp157 family protein n=1 Tax=Paenibacillus senegalensis TaxID=1465766 RepID=UPI00028A2BBB|nr:siphovirus Gp157 family protein [Paenibacillus senegalensis]
MRLYDLTEQYQDLLDMLEQDPDNPSLQAMLDGLEGAIEDKVENIVKVIKSLEAQEKALETEAKNMMSKKSAVRVNIDRLKEHTTDLLNKSGLEKVKGTLHSAWLQNNPASVSVVDESIIPKTYYVTPEPVLVKRMVLEDLKSGLTIPGVELKQGKSLRVR